MRLVLSPENRPIVIASLFIVAILLAGTAYTLSTTGTAPLLSPHGAVSAPDKGQSDCPSGDWFAFV